MTERTAIPEPIHGVSFGAYATVHAGLEDGLALAAMLALANLRPEVWARADAAWTERLLDDLTAGGTLDEALMEAKAAAQQGWIRRLPPLDTDLDEWLAFSQAWAEAVDGDALLAGVGMRVADITRLETLWGMRLRADPALAARAVELLSEPPRTPCQPSPAPAELPRPL